MGIDSLRLFGTMAPEVKMKKHRRLEITQILEFPELKKQMVRVQSIISPQFEWLTSNSLLEMHMDVTNKYEGALPSA